MGEGYIDNEDIASIGTYTYEDTPPAMYQVKVGLERNSWHHDDDDGSFFFGKPFFDSAAAFMCVCE